LERIRKWEGKYSKDWTIFANDWRQNGERLPLKDDGDYYQEWTVDTPWLDSRWARRIVTWKWGEYYYSDNHYLNFIKIK
jgi:ribonuclease T1